MSCSFSNKQSQNFTIKKNRPTEWSYKKIHTHNKQKKRIWVTVNGPFRVYQCRCAPGTDRSTAFPPSCTAPAPAARVSRVRVSVPPPGPRGALERPPNPDPRHIHTSIRRRFDNAPASSHSHSVFFLIALVLSERLLLSELIARNLSVRFIISCCRLCGF